MRAQSRGEGCRSGVRCGWRQVSGSMYRFNGDDGRLDRTLETAAMFMEALQGFEHKVVYTMVGHSGDGAAIDLGASDYARPPQNDKERFKILQASPGR